jgi:hypothetical protein
MSKAYSSLLCLATRTFELHPTVPAFDLYSFLTLEYTYPVSTYLPKYTLLRYFVGRKIHPCLSTNCVSEATMVVSYFGPYHRLVHGDAPTKHAGVIITPWGATGTWSYVPSPHHPVFVRFYGKPVNAPFTMNMCIYLHWHHCNCRPPLTEHPPSCRVILEDGEAALVAPSDRQHDYIDIAPAVNDIIKNITK